jgi:hypothetical protein
VLSVFGFAASGNDPKINRVLPLPQGNHVVKFGKDPIYRTKVIVRKRPCCQKLYFMIPLWKAKNHIYVGVIRLKVKVTINIIFDNRVVSA